MTKEELIQAISDDKMMPFIQPDQLAGIVDFVIKNYRPSLPSNLDEAAEKSGLEYAPIISGEAMDSSGQFYETDDVDWPSRCGFIKGFKAGAEWMAGQGETHELTVESPVLGPPMICCPVHADNGDKVIVQIRKK